MKKTKIKTLFIVFSVLLLISTFSFATANVTAVPISDNITSTEAPVNTTAQPTNTTNTTNTTTDTTNTTDNTTGTTDTTTPDITQGSYTEHGTDIVFDKLVNGNVYLFGNNITFKANSGINGDLFVVGNNITFEATSFNDAIQVYRKHLYHCYK